MHLYMYVYVHICLMYVCTVGSSSTLAGGIVVGFVDGQGTMARFFNPLGIAVDLSGQVFVSDFNNIRMVNPSGIESYLGSLI